MTATYNTDGSYDLSTPARREEALKATLTSVLSCVQAYHSRGPDFVVSEIQRIASATLRALPAEAAVADTSAAPAPRRVRVLTVGDRSENGWLFGYAALPHACGDFAEEFACVLVDGESGIRTFHCSKVSAS